MITFKIEQVRETNIGRCYNRYDYVIISCKKLSSDKIKQLYNMGLIGWGQEFKIESVCDGTEQYDPDKKGYEYKCFSNVDSSD